MDKRFNEALASLNNKQRQAVMTLDGPLLVIAGPGTGKTQLLSARVAQIIRTTDTRASNILCLTFTNKAAVNMKERIIELAGPEGARVEASTFHSFAGEIMNLYPDYFWNAAQLSVAPGALQLDIIESIVAGLPLDNPLSLKFAGQYTLINEIQASIGLAKDAGLTPEKLQAIVKGNLAYIDLIEEQMVSITEARLAAKSLGELSKKLSVLPLMEINQNILPLVPLSTVITESLEQAISSDEGTGKTANTSAWKRRWVQTIDGKKGMYDERRRNSWWLELAAVYAGYREQIHARGYFDYADMLVECISQLEQNPEILADVQERFHYVMLDEFQDTNPAQMRLAHLVSDHYSSNGRPNLMAVGDDDQSIFKFNGAELNNMLDFKRSYPAAKFIVLTDSYRSSQAVLDKAQSIIEQAGTRLVNIDVSLNKKLRAASPPKEPGTIDARSFSSRELQLSTVAREIKKNYSPKRSTAVLARNHDSLLRMTGILNSLGVPVRYEQQSNILEHEIVNQLYLLMRVLTAIQHGDQAEINGCLHRIIRHPAWDIGTKVLWKTALKAGRDGNWLEVLLQCDDPKLSKMGQWLLWQAREAGNQPLAITIEQLIGLRPADDYTSNLKNYYSSPEGKDANKYLRGLSAIQLLRALAHDFARTGEATLVDFVRFIEINNDNHKIVADESPFITGGHAVQLLTVHKAKGLEFDEVYLIDAIDDYWSPRKGGRKPPANLPLRPAQDDFDDFVRLMYVAATRARSSLHVTAYYQDHAGKEVAVSPIVQSAFEVAKISDPGTALLISVLEENLRWPDLSGGQEKEMLKAKLETYSLSVTALLNFLDVTAGGPRYFMERNLLRLPDVRTARQSYGTAMHAALEAAQKLVNKDKFKPAAVKDVLGDSLRAEQMGESDFKRYLKEGSLVLDRLFIDYEYRMPKGSLPEQNYKNLRLADAVIGGKLDRVDNDGGSVTIIDYKTGSPLSSLATADKSKAIKAYKHKTQLVFYALLAGLQPSLGGTGNFECQMVYVEADTKKRLILSYNPSPEDISRLTKLIEAVWVRIVNLELPDISGYSADIDGIRQFEDDLINKRAG